MPETWVRCEDRCLSAVLCGVDGDGRVDLGMVVFGTVGEVRGAIADGPFDAEGFVELAYPGTIDGELVRVTRVKILPDFVVDVIPCGWDDVLQADWEDLDELLDDPGV